MFDAILWREMGDSKNRRKLCERLYAANWEYPTGKKKVASDGDTRIRAEISLVKKIFSPDRGHSPGEV
jgi:hypothetical protein